MSAIALARPKLRVSSAPLLLLLYAAFWTLYAVLSHWSGAVHQDMTEAYAWGREFQLGYHKHPPFWAWIAGAWFSFMPRTNWAFETLSVANATIGLWGAWRLIGCFAQGEKRVAATLLLVLTPLYSFLALKYNANSIFLSLWPWTAYFFVRSIDRGSLLDSVLFGVLAAAAVLSKYYAVVLLAGCLIAACAHPERRRYFRSALPYVALGVAALLIAPHLWWLTTSSFLPVHYVAHEMRHSFLQTLDGVWVYLGGCLAFLLFAAFLVFLARRDPLRGAVGAARKRLGDPRVRFLAALCLSPYLLTALSGLLLRLHLDPAMSLGVLCLFPLLLIEAAGEIDFPWLLRWTRRSIGLLFAVALCAAPAAGYFAFAAGQTPAAQPIRELSEQATRSWYAVTGAPLSIVGGISPFSNGIVFYGADRSSEFTNMRFDHAPWVTPTEIARRGLLIACPQDRFDCLDRAEAFATADTVRFRVALTHSMWGRQGVTRTFTLLVIPPRKANSPPPEPQSTAGQDGDHSPPPADPPT